MKKVLKSQLYINIASVIGLWLPMPFLQAGVTKKNIISNEAVVWNFTLQIGKIPLGWLMVITALLINHV